MIKQTYKLKKYAVIGNPITHSKSPIIHKKFAKQTGKKIKYDLLLSSPKEFKNNINLFIKNKGNGMNVTIPFKFEAYLISDFLTERSKLSRSVNTLYFDKKKKIYGDNTDGIGLVNDIEKNLGIKLKKMKILLIGAGGSAYGIINNILICNPYSLTIVNRTKDKAIKLVKYFKSTSINTLCKLNYVDINKIESNLYDIIINATSSSINKELPISNKNIFSKCILAYDLMYSKKPTTFINYTQKLGVYSKDGLGMLVEQAAESFFLWHGIRPNSKEILLNLRKEI